ncbi:carboxy-terminal kinesin 2-like isoform X2 [Anneissia japonica]|uniref:carboxy-terminal kinesin 2-like isoform X2 n=1 Tax=Anneissia japonica TaxID=1529436 RepID=UPI001425BAAE|nr:carboxy-terminal kinesin 2-like isoform X2 [Anneissia japonica]
MSSSSNVARPALGARDANAPVATVRPTSKLPVMSKLPKPQFKRPLAEDARGSAAKKTKIEAPSVKSGTGIPKGTVGVRKAMAPGNTTTVRKQPVRKPPEASTAPKKRPAWDLKGRLSDMEKMMEMRISTNNHLEHNLSENNQRVQMVEMLNERLKGTVAQKDHMLSENCQTINELQRKIRDLEDEAASVKRRHQCVTEDLESRNSTLEIKKKSLEGELEVSNQECIGLKCKIAQMTSARVGMETELSSIRGILEQAQQTCKHQEGVINGLNNTIVKHNSTIQELESNLQEAEAVRRKLHNTVQELKGNIRVFCRVRPLLPSEKDTCAEISHLHFNGIDGKTLEMDKVDENCPGQRKLSGGKYSFTFDQVFNPSSSQMRVFEEISQMVQSALDGYNVCIFAYGQTGSGKTYTMEGPVESNEETMGMIPRAVAQIFKCTQDLKANGWKYTMEASFLEIYNETIRDLLVNGEDKLKHDIKADAQVTNLTLVEVKSEKQVAKLLEKASCNRSVAATNCNEHSSRSHSVFRLKLTGSNDLTSEECEGTLNLVDLAGSERLTSSGSSGERLRETKNINKSLSNLGNVIMSLGNKESHIPYRNSKLTYLLQNSLGGNSKTLMFVNISPKEENFGESLCSLRFATKVNQCNIGTAQKKVK